MKKSWQEKYFSSNSFKIERLEKDYSDMHIGEDMLIATPLMIAEYIHTLPSGEIWDSKTIRKALALANGADHTCPLTYGIFLRIVCEYNYEQFLFKKNIEAITPFWRATPPKSPILNKLSFDIQFITERQNAEKNG